MCRIYDYLLLILCGFSDSDKNRRDALFSSKSGRHGPSPNSVILFSDQVLSRTITAAGSTCR